MAIQALDRALVATKMAPTLFHSRVKPSRASVRARGHGDSSMSEDDSDYVSDSNRTPYFTQSERKFLDLITIQALKNCLHYLQESNGEMHMYLHAYIHDNPFNLSETKSMDDWLVQLAAQPLKRVSDPRRSSIPGAAAEEAALRGGREVSPRDLVERILAARKHVAQELSEVTNNITVKNNAIFTKALSTSIKLSDDDV